ncbi:MAG: TonB family protein [Candidatus Sulfotelmatobacter sp.]
MTLIDVGKNWEGRVIDGKFPLLQWLGGSEDSAVFLTERRGSGPQKAAIKLIRAEVFSSNNFDEADQLSRWADGAKLSHPHLIRLFESGRGQIDASNFLYVVMEYAEENLAQILPLRPLSPEEVKEMLPPTAQALSFLHQAGFAHGRIKPSNIMAVDNQLKISADSLRKAGERDKQALSAYTAPEVDSTGPSPAADAWSLGAMLVAVLTQHEPLIAKSKDGGVAIQDTIPQPFYGIAERCLRFDPQRRCTINEVLGKPAVQEPPPAIAIEKPVSAKRSTIWIILPVIAAIILLAVLFGRRSHQPPVPPAESHPAQSPNAANVPAAQSPAPFHDRATPTQTGIAKGRVLQQVLPEVSQGARNTIQGHIKIGVQVSVDTSGNVSQARLISPGPSKYFANQALTAARHWKFSPPQLNGQPSPSEWILHFQFGRTLTQVFPAETKP